MTTTNPQAAADAIVAILTAAGMNVTGDQIEADSIDIHIRHTVEAFLGDYQQVSLSWRPTEGWYLMPFDPADDTTPTNGPAERLTAADADGIVRQVVALLTEEVSPPGMSDIAGQ